MGKDGILRLRGNSGDATGSVPSGSVAPAPAPFPRTCRPAEKACGKPRCRHPATGRRFQIRLLTYKIPARATREGLAERL